MRTRYIFTSIFRDLTPPFLWRTLKEVLLLKKSPPFHEWEYIQDGWKVVNTNPKVKGWNVDSILEAYKAKWPIFCKNLEGTSPLGISPDSSKEERTDLTAHNIMMSYAYVLALVSLHKKSLSMLDWGGGFGHYYLISQRLIPDLSIDYHCKDFPQLIQYGKILFPEATFYADETCFRRQYDFVLASTSLHYSQDWQAVFKNLAKTTAEHLLVTRLPVVHQAQSYVMVQRPYEYGYDTEYLGWCLNRDDFLDTAQAYGLQLLREFIVQPSSYVHHAPEQPEYRGFLFHV